MLWAVNPLTRRDLSVSVIASHLSLAARSLSTKEHKYPHSTGNRELGALTG